MNFIDVLYFGTVVRKIISKKTKVKGAAKEQGSASRRSHKKSKVVDESNDENEDGADHEDAGFHVIGICVNFFNLLDRCICII